MNKGTKALLVISINVPPTFTNLTTRTICLIARRRHTHIQAGNTLQTPITKSSTSM